MQVEKNGSGYYLVFTNAKEMTQLILELNSIQDDALTKGYPAKIHVRSGPA